MLCRIGKPQCIQTRSSSKFFGEPSTNPTSTIRKRRNRRRSIQRVEPFSLVETPVVTMADQRTMAELLRAPTEGYVEAIIVPPIPADHFELKHSLINLVTSKQFFGFEKEDPHAHIRYFNKITSTLKYKDVPETSIKLMLFPFSIDGLAWIWLEKEPPRSILTWDDLIQGSPSSKPTSRFYQITSTRYLLQWFKPIRSRFLNSAAGGNLLERSAQDVLKIIKNKSKVHNSRNKPIVSQVKASNVDSSEIASAITSAVTSAMTAMFKQHQCTATDGNTFSGYPDNIQGYVSAAAVVEWEPEVTKDTVLPSTENIQPPVVQIQALIDEPVVAPKPKPSIPYPLRANKQRLHEKDDNLASKFVEIFRELHFELSFADALLHMPKFASMDVRDCQGGLEAYGMWGSFGEEGESDSDSPCGVKDFKELARIAPECLDECLALADLGASINLNAFPYGKKLITPELTPTQMILELADRSTTRPADIAEDVFVKVGKFHFPTDFVVVDYVVDPRVPLILGRPFLRTARALIDVYGENYSPELMMSHNLKVGKTARYSNNDVVSINRIDVIDVACEEYAQEVLGFSDNSTSGNPTPSLDPILSTSSPSLTPFEEGDFILEEIEACLTNDSIPLGIDDDDFDLEGDLLLLEKLIKC
ncbi:reverse transcriptase domain-containing protein [Tanacetum coccineum]